jgi:hypothetical protein
MLLSSKSRRNDEQAALEEGNTRTQSKVAVVVVAVAVAEYNDFLVESSIVQVLAWCLATTLQVTQVTIVKVVVLGLDREGKEQ